MVYSENFLRIILNNRTIKPVTVGDIIVEMMEYNLDYLTPEFLGVKQVQIKVNNLKQKWRSDAKKWNASVDPGFH